MPNELLVSDAPGQGGVPVVPAGVMLRPLDERRLPAAGRAYWRTYLGTPLEMTLREATEDVGAAWTGEYGRWLADGCLTAWEDDVLVAAVVTVEDPPWPDVPPGPFILDLFVLPGARRRGIGRALVATVQRTVGPGPRLRVDDTAHDALALYASLGFRSVAGAQ